MITNASEILFRCSGLGHIMPSDKSKTEFTDTCLTHLVDLFVSAKYERKQEIDSKFIRKGNLREEDSITLLSRIKKQMYRKNEMALQNKFIKGTLDLYLGESIEKAVETIDTKTSWSANTFFRSQRKLDKMYEWQGHGYMALSAAKKHTVAYCLVNGTIEAILDEKRKLEYVMNVIDAEHDENYRERCKQVEINHIFDLAAFIKEYPHFDFHSDIAEWRYDIPKEERLCCFEFERDEAKIQAIYDRVTACRNWMNMHLFKLPVPELNKIIHNP